MFLLLCVVCFFLLWTEDPTIKNLQHTESVRPSLQCSVHWSNDNNLTRKETHRGVSVVQSKGDFKTWRDFSGLVIWPHLLYYWFIVEQFDSTVWTDSWLVSALCWTNCNDECFLNPSNMKQTCWFVSCRCESLKHLQYLYFYLISSDSCRLTVRTSSDWFSEQTV